MAEYTKVFDNPYPDGWKDLPSEETPITASALQEHTDAIENIENYLEENPIGGGGSSDVQWNQIQTDGAKIAEIIIDGISTNVFAPTGGSGSSIPWTYIKDIDLSGNNAVSIPELDDYDEFYIHSDTDFDILNQYFIKDVTPRINVGAFSSTTYYCLVLGTIDWTNKTIKKDAYAHNGWSTSCKFKLYGRKLTSSGGTSDYSELTNKPKIEDVELNGDMTLEDLGIQFKVNAEHKLNGMYISYTKEKSVTAKLNELDAIVGQANDLLEGAL